MPSSLFSKRLDDAVPSIDREGDVGRCRCGLAPPRRSLLFNELSDILHAETQLTKALPKIGGSGVIDQLRELFEEHLAERKTQMKRITNASNFSGGPSVQAVQMHDGLVEEGQEIIVEGEEKKTQRRTSR